jgi:hypothetical protein
VLLVLGLVTPALLLLGPPTVAYLAFSIYTVGWLSSSFALALRQAREFATMRRYRSIDWHARLRHLTDPYARMHALADRTRLTQDEADELVALNNWVHSGPEVPVPDDVHHLVVMPVANEDAGIVRQSLDAILAADYPRDRIMVALSIEARSRVWDAAAIEELTRAYDGRFGRFMVTRHPDGLPGEGKVKGANISWGARLARQELHRAGIRDEQMIVSAFDSDTRASRHYFSVLTYTHLTNPDRDVDSYQPVLLFHNNVWEVPAASRLVGYVASMWTLVDSTRPERLRIFSSHAMGMPALVKVNFWSTNVIPDDSRQFWRMFFDSDGRAKTVPLHLPVYLDAVHADTYWSTLQEQYKQIRRWSYGVIDFPYIMEQNASHPRIPLRVKLVQTLRQLFQFHFWATVPLMLLALRPLISHLQPLVVHSSLMLTDLAAIANLVVLALSPVSLVISAVVALRLLPMRPANRPKWTWAKLAGEFVLLPLVAPIFFCFPAMDAQIRLMFRRYLGFRVTVKSRRQVAHQVR